MRFLRWLLYLVVGIAVVIGGVFFAARFGDGPIALIPGGPLVAGELVTAPVSDWSFAATELEIELQLLDPARSRTVWVLVHDGKAYVPCSLSFPPMKSWHYEAVEDGRAIVRVQGKRYPVQLTQVTDETLLPQLGEIAQEKYPMGPPGDRANVWVFKLDSRPEQAG